MPPSGRCRCNPVVFARNFLADLLAWPWMQTLATFRQRFREERLGLTAGSLTFTTLISWCLC